MSFYLLEHREWDTNFFKKKMARLLLCENPIPGSSGIVSDLIEQAKKENYKHILARFPSTRNLEIGELEAVGFRYFGSIVELKKDKYSHRQTRLELQEAHFLKKDEIPQIIHWARELFKHSYMYNDPFFEKKIVDQLHEIWINNLVSSSKTVILTTRSYEKITGFVSLKQEKEGFEIDLFGVHHEHQGQGISKELLALSEGYIQQLNLNFPLKVRTQGENLAAVNAYNQGGFKIQSYYLNLCHHLGRHRE